jgi:hypothetical protein
MRFTTEVAEGTEEEAGFGAWRASGRAVGFVALVVVRSALF